MDRERWETVNRIFHDALDVESSDRRAFVAAASNGDSEIEDQVHLLLKADSQAGTFLETPLVPAGFFGPIAVPAPLLHPGELLCGRFQILRAVAEGGMGFVFEALDTELSVHIAVKVIRPEIASNPEAILRFRQEVRLARRISHPNVCRTYDLERDVRVIDEKRGLTREIFFLTMEFLEGETLAAKIRREGPIPLDQALPIARQVCDALQAAHRLGVVHRDIKPANIVLVPAASTGQAAVRAVITDFGLARLDPVLAPAAQSVLSHTAKPLGTLAYMAPEQLEGSPVSPATDIYSLGLVLFEMVTGRRAFGSDNFLSGIAQRLTGSPPSPAALVPSLPDQWCRAIEGSLRVRPSERFQSTEELMAVLEGSRERLAPVQPSASSARPGPNLWPLRHRGYAISFLAVILVSLFAVGLRLYQSRTDPKVAPGALVYLTQVKNQTGEKTFDNLTELIQAGLTQSAQINLLDQGRIGDTLERMAKPPETVIDEPIAREIAMRTGAVRVVFATVSGTRGSYQLDIDIQKPDNTPARFFDHWKKTFTWQSSASTNSGTTIPPELLTAVRTSSNWIRKEAGESANDIARLDVPPEDVTTGNWEALAEYTKGENLYRLGKTDDAVIALQKAALSDNHFALAFARLGDLYASLGRTNDSYHAYYQALKTDYDQRLSRRELDRIKGIYASDSWDFEAAQSAFRDYTVYYENDYTGWFYRALPLIRLHRLDEAINTLKKAYSLDRKRPNAPFDLAACYLELGDFAAAEQWIQVLRNIPHPEASAQLEGIIAFLKGDKVASRKKFESLRSSPSSIFRLRAFSFLARLDAESDNLKGSSQWIEAGISEASSDGNTAQQASFLMDRATYDAHWQTFKGAAPMFSAVLHLKALLSCSFQRAKLSRSVYRMHPQQLRAISKWTFGASPEGSHLIHSMRHTPSPRGGLKSKRSLRAETSRRPFPWHGEWLPVTHI